MNQIIKVGGCNCICHQTLSPHRNCKGCVTPMTNNEKNMCDGCQRGFPLINQKNPLSGEEEFIHPNGHSFGFCTKDRYVEEKKCCDECLSLYRPADNKPVCFNPVCSCHSSPQQETLDERVDIITRPIPTGKGAELLNGNKTLTETPQQEKKCGHCNFSGDYNHHDCPVCCLCHQVHSPSQEPINLRNPHIEIKAKAAGTVELKGFPSPSLPKECICCYGNERITIGNISCACVCHDWQEELRVDFGKRKGLAEYWINFISSLISKAYKEGNKNTCPRCGKNTVEVHTCKLHEYHKSNCEAEKEQAFTAGKEATLTVIKKTPAGTGEFKFKEDIIKAVESLNPPK